MLLGQSAMCGMAKRTLKEFEEVSEVSNTSLKVRIWSFLKMATCFFALLAAAPLFYTSISPQTSRGGGGVAAFWLSVFVSVFAPVFQLFRIRSHHNFLPF